jgi:hypothetical protein
MNLFYRQVDRDLLNDGHEFQLHPRSFVQGVKFVACFLSVRQVEVHFFGRS